MKKICLALVLVLLMATSAFAIVFESITVADTAIGLTSTNLDWTKTTAFCTVETSQIRFLYDGTTPTASVGHVANVGDAINLESYEELRNFKAIRTGAASGVLRCSY